MTTQRQRRPERTFLRAITASVLYFAALWIQDPWLKLFPAYCQAADSGNLGQLPGMEWDILTLVLFGPLLAVGVTRTLAAWLPLNLHMAGHRAWRWGAVLIVIPCGLLMTNPPNWPGVPPWQILGATVEFFPLVGLIMILTGGWLLRVKARQEGVRKLDVPQEGVWPPAPRKD